MTKKRKLAILGLTILGGMYLATIVVGFLGMTGLTITLFALGSVVTIIFFFILKSYERNKMDLNLDEPDDETQE